MDAPEGQQGQDRSTHNGTDRLDSGLDRSGSEINRKHFQQAAQTLTSLCLFLSKWSKRLAFELFQLLLRPQHFDFVGIRRFRLADALRKRRDLAVQELIAQTHCDVGELLFRVGKLTFVHGRLGDEAADLRGFKSVEEQTQISPTTFPVGLQPS